MWIPNTMVDDVQKVAVIFYVDWQRAKVWNDNRNANQPRLMTGWVWSAKSGDSEQAGFKTITAAYIDAWWHLVQGTAPPKLNRQRKR